jgi:hypothetical protein
MTDRATTANLNQTPSSNPWHHMKGIQRHLRNEGKILPKRRLMRPRCVCSADQRGRS